MSRPHGTRDKKFLYDQIINQLRKHPEGQNAYTIGQTLKINDATCRLYLSDLVEQERVIGIPVNKKITKYILTNNQ